MALTISPPLVADNASRDGALHTRVRCLDDTDLLYSPECGKPSRPTLVGTDGEGTNGCTTSAAQSQHRHLCSSRRKHRCPPPPSITTRSEANFPMKRAIALTAAAGLLFAACSSNEPASEPAVETSATTEAAVEAPAEGPSEDETVEQPPAETEVPPDEPPEEAGLSVDTINVAYFEQWPTPNLIGLDDDSFDTAVGAEINWVPFGGSSGMSEAMTAGDIDISYSQVLAPFVETGANGADIKLVGIAVEYSEADNCVAQGRLGVTRNNAAAALDGATVMAPSGTVTAFKMLSMMEFLGVDIDSLNILPTDSSATTLAAFASGDIDVGCAFGSSLFSMIEDNDGALIMTGAETISDLGIRTYDIVSIPTSFGEAHADAVAAFLKATQDFNDIWAANPAGTNDIIANASGLEDVENFLTGPTWFSFPTLEEQLGDDWLGGTVAADMSAQIQALIDLDRIDSTIVDLSGSVDTSFLKTALG
jgi:taurine transport system substrate-binding protein